MDKLLTTTIRKALLQDAAAIASNHICSWQETYKEYIPASVLNSLSLKEKTEQWRALIKQKVDILVVEVEHEIVGFLSMCVFRDAKPNNNDGEISAIYLHPAYWRQGLGTKLCQIAFAELSKSGFKYVYVWVLSRNNGARVFYESLGFAMTQEKK